MPEATTESEPRTGSRHLDRSYRDTLSTAILTFSATRAKMSMKWLRNDEAHRHRGPNLPASDLPYHDITT